MPGIRRIHGLRHAPNRMAHPGALPASSSKEPMTGNRVAQWETLNQSKIPLNSASDK
jgi:hypothetical protein